MRRIYSLILWSLQGCPVFFGGGGGGSPPSPPPSPMPTRDDPAGAAESANRAAKLRKGLGDTILADASAQEGQTLGSQTILGSTAANMYGSGTP